MEGLKIIEAEIENFKNIEKKIVNIDGKSLIIIGGNNKGKSSFIQALLSPLDSSYLPTEPIKDGEDRASIKVKISGELFNEYKEYTIDLYFTESNKKGRMVMTNHLGEVVKNGKSMIKSILGNIGFDMFSFIKSSPAKQVETLKQLAGINFNELDVKRKEIYDARTYTNGRIKEEESIVKNHGYTQEQLDKYEKPIDDSSLKEEMANITKNIEYYLRVEAGIRERQTYNINGANEVEELQYKIEEYQKEIFKMKEGVEILRGNMSKNEVEINKGKEWLLKNPKPSANEIQAQLTTVEQHNKEYNKVLQYVKKLDDINKLKQKADSLSNQINDIDNQKQEMIKSSKMPIEGLSFNEEQVFYNGLPLEESQINKAKIIEIGTRIAMAVNPNLRVIIINDGSLLDKEQLATIIKIVTENNYQLIIEKVDFDGSDLEIKFTEDYLN